jgi:hypothetical protein
MKNVPESVIQDIVIEYSKFNFSAISFLRINVIASFSLKNISTSSKLRIPNSLDFTENVISQSYVQASYSLAIFANLSLLTFLSFIKLFSF